MATLGEAILYLSTDDSKIGQGLNSAKQQATDWASSLGGTVSTLVGGAVVAGVGAAATAFVGLGVTGFNASMEIDQAQRELQGTLGVTADEAEWLGAVGVKVFKDNFAGSLEEAIAAVGLAQKALGDLSDQELADATENAYRLSDAFEVDVAEGLNQAGVLMKEFGLTQQEAFDFMASGFQNGLNASDDFLDSIGEYSNLFADAGFTADEFYSIMQTGAAGGVLGTDKIADAIKEMQIRLNEGGDAVKSAFGDIGLDFNNISAAVTRGDAEWADYFDKIVGGINGIEDPIKRAQVQTAIFGTMAEDLGVSFTEGLSAGQTSLEDMSGAIDKIDVRYNNFGSMATGLWRNLVIAITPVTDKLLDMANNAMPYAIMAVDWLSTQIQVLIPILEQWADWFVSVAVPAIIEFMTPIINQLIPGLQLLGDIVLNLATAIWPYILQAFTFLTDNMNIVLPILAAVGVAILAIASPVTLIAGLIVLLATAWANNWGNIQGITQAALDFITPYITTAMATIQAVVTTVLNYLSAWWQQHGDNLMTIVNTVWTWIQTYIGVQINTIMTVITVVGGLIMAFWQEWGDILIAGAERTWENIKTIIGAAMDILGYLIDAGAALIRGDWNALGEALRNIWQTAWDAVGSILENAGETLKAVMKKLSEEMLKIWEDIKTKFRDIGKALIDSLKQGISDAWDGLVSWFNDKLDDLLGTVDDVFEFGSPSKILIEKGRLIPESLQIGMAERSYLPIGAAAAMSQQIVNNFTQTINTSSAPNVGSEFNQLRALIST